jgi:hypothetical protein
MDMVKIKSETPMRRACSPGVKQYGTDQPMDQWTNGSMDQQTNGPTNQPMITKMGTNGQNLDDFHVLKIKDLKDKSELYRGACTRLKNSWNNFICHSRIKTNNNWIKELWASQE